ncbi:MAG: hypothetical protein PVH29_06665 [Candidatus Zixiibacteriota bacterium]
MRLLGAGLLLWATAAFAGAGMFLGEMGVGAAVGGASFFGTYAFTNSMDDGWQFIIPGCAFMAGAGSGVYLLGELVDGRSANPWASFGAALGGAALGTAVCTTPGILVAKGGGGENESYTAIAFGVTAGIIGGTAASAWLYNAVKKPAGGRGARAPMPTPTVAALAPRRGEGAPTITYGVAWSF